MSGITFPFIILLLVRIFFNVNFPLFWKEIVAKRFTFQCHDDCSCLPPPNRKYIHQTYRTADSSKWLSSWEAFQGRWRDLHPDWEHVFWTDTENDLLAKCTNYGKYFQMDSNIKKADVARLLYMYHIGGLYVDMDYVPIQRIDVT